MPPDQVQGKPADARSDIFSFGATLYKILSGQRAFAARSQAEALSAIPSATRRNLWPNRP
jgi:serine/threonine protein kinase